MLEILNGFSKRMEFIAIVDSITNRKGTTDKIENLFSENQMENLIISTLIYIMEVNLMDEEAATIENITYFLKKILPMYLDKEVNLDGIDEKEITRYIVKDILQNKGQNRYFNIKNYENGIDEGLNVRLITDKLNDDNEVIYELTKQGYDFLFRTKEVDDELGFKIEEFKLKMLIQKKNYKKAIVSSQEIIRMLKNMEISFSQFEESFKSNINSIPGSDYEKLIDELYNTLDEGYKEMQNLEVMIEKSNEQIKEEERLQGTVDEKIQNAKKEVYKISVNIKKALSMQVNLLNTCTRMKKIYLDVLQEAMEYSFVKTYNFREVILDKLEKVENLNRVTDIYAKLLKPLFLPRMDKKLNLSLCYDVQGKIKTSEQEEYSLEQELVETSLENEKRIDRRNNAHVEIISELLKYALLHKDGFMVDDFLEYLKDNESYKEMIEEKLIFMVFLKLYSFDEIDLEKCQFEADENGIESNGEFDFIYCLKKIRVNEPNLYGIKKIKVERTDEVFEFEYIEEDSKKAGRMTRLKFSIV